MQKCARCAREKAVDKDGKNTANNLTEMGELNKMLGGRRGRR